MITTKLHVALYLWKLYPMGSNVSGVVRDCIKIHEERQTQSVGLTHY